LRVLETRDHAALAGYFGQRRRAHVYALADLDAPFWAHARAFVGVETDVVVAAALLLDITEVPILYAVNEPAHPPTRALLDTIADEIPTPCFFNLAKGLTSVLPWTFESHGQWMKMTLLDRPPPGKDDVRAIEFVDVGGLDELQAFYQRRAYRDGEGGFFAPYMLELEPYAVGRTNGEIVAAGGVHVVSDRFGVAAIGNIAVKPQERGRGWATLITRALALELNERVDLIALNVREDNEAAIRCYTGLGFAPCIDYEEGFITAR
jgi:ribosomal protein S18 acetylase RimI-like enzyme